MTMQIARHKAFAVALAMVVLCVARAPLLIAQGGGYRIAGKVVSSTSGAVLSQVRVTVASVEDSARTTSVVTGEDGTFVFTNLPAGKYSLSAARRGFIESTYMQHGQYSTAIVTGADVDAEHLVFRLTPQAVLTGTVFDGSGDPVRRARVSLYRQDQSMGIGRVARLTTANTDDRGTYEFAELAAGNYFLSVSARPWYAMSPRSQQMGGGTSTIRNSDGTETTVSQEESVTTPQAVPTFDVAYPTTYYPDATDSDEATPIPLRGGERLTVDMHVSPVPALRVVFRVPSSPDRGFSMPQIMKRSFDSADDSLLAYMDRGPAAEDEPRPGMFNMIGQGVFELSGIPAGKYTMQTRADPGSGTASTRSEVEITQDGQEISPSAGEPSGAKFTVRIAGEARIPPGLMLALRTPERKVVRGAPVDAQGSCEMQDIPPGHYELLAGTPNNDYAVTSMVLNGSTSRGHNLEVVAGTSIDATVTLIGGRAVVQGIARRDGKGVAGAMIVLVPKDPDAHSELFRRDQSDLDGTFSLGTVIPSEYTIVAIEDGWELDWAKQGVIAHYLPKGQKIVISPAQREPLQLPEPVEVQAK